LIKTWTLLKFFCPQPDNIRHYMPGLEMKDVTLTTVYESGVWIAVIYGRSGEPICSTLGQDTTAVAALRNMLKHTSERVALNGFVDDYLNKVDYHVNKTSAGTEHIVSCT
jgi:hypothetical protein